MTTITLDEQLNKQFNLLANQAHITIDKAVNDALREYLADYSDLYLQKMHWMNSVIMKMN